MLLLEYPHKKAKLILPKDLPLGTNAQTCVKNIHEIFKIMVEGETIFNIYFKNSVQLFLYYYIGVDGGEQWLEIVRAYMLLRVSEACGM